MNDHNRRRANRNRSLVRDIKIQRGCADCGYREHHAALEFDHRPGVTKKQTVASMMYWSWDVILAEIDKCDVVCANCHAIRTHERKMAP